MVGGGHVGLTSFFKRSRALSKGTPRSVLYLTQYVRRPVCWDLYTGCASAHKGPDVGYCADTASYSAVRLAFASRVAKCTGNCALRYVFFVLITLASLFHATVAKPLLSVPPGINDDHQRQR